MHHFAEFFANVAQKWKHVLYVPGNHEYYSDQPIDSINQKIMEVCNQWSNVHLLNRNTVVIDGQRFLGCTLWSRPLSATTRMLNDFRRIPGCTPDTMSEWHTVDRTWLDHNVKQGDIVVTHFMPLQNKDLMDNGIKSRYPLSPLDHYFGNDDMTDIFSRTKMWISGHTHQPFKVTIGDTLWVCNPLGLPGEHVPDTELVVQT